ncbi:MAG: hypothetical protein MOGMAGMI_02050 [Candidatus Omnitrophica bacterium]|nr:hypothetical protein [Candidatus Omnitrophota bacterium]
MRGDDAVLYEAGQGSGNVLHALEDHRRLTVQCHVITAASLKVLEDGHIRHAEAGIQTELAVLEDAEELQTRPHIGRDRIDVDGDLVLELAAGLERNGVVQVLVGLRGGGLADAVERAVVLIGDGPDGVAADVARLVRQLVVAPAGQHPAGADLQAELLGQRAGRADELGVFAFERKERRGSL